MTESSINIQESETKHDFLNDKRLFLLILGFGKGRGASFFIVLAYVSCVLIQVSGLTALYLLERKTLKFLCLYSVLLSIYAFYGLTMRLRTGESLDSTRAAIARGIFSYEEVSEEELRMRKKNVLDIKMRINVLLYGLTIGGLAFIVILPVSQYFFLEETEEDVRREVVSPYLAIPLYIPLDTRTPAGYLIGVLANLVYVVTCYGYSTALTQIYLSCTLQLKVELQVLNHSLRTIESRARRLYGRLYGRPRHDERYRGKEYHLCMTACLRANLLHHIAIIRFHNLFKVFTGALLFISALFGSVLYASKLYLILSGPPPHLIIIFVFTFLTELAYNFFLCYVGEELLHESSNLRDSLYATPWYNCDRSFRSLLFTMMVYCSRPLTLKTIFLDFTASNETYGDLISAMYTFLNLVRQGDK